MTNREIDLKYIENEFERFNFFALTKCTKYIFLCECIGHLSIDSWTGHFDKKHEKLINLIAITINWF